MAKLKTCEIKIGWRIVSLLFLSCAAIFLFLHNNDYAIMTFLLSNLSLSWGRTGVCDGK